jgi:hypothetical protein
MALINRVDLSFDNKFYILDISEKNYNKIDPYFIDINVKKIKTQSIDHILTVQVNPKTEIKFKIDDDFYSSVAYYGYFFIRAMFNNKINLLVVKEYRVKNYHEFN